MCSWWRVYDLYGKIRISQSHNLCTPIFCVLWHRLDLLRYMFALCTKYSIIIYNIPKQTIINVSSYFWFCLSIRFTKKKYWEWQNYLYDIFFKCDIVMSFCALHSSVSFRCYIIMWYWSMYFPLLFLFLCLGGICSTVVVYWTAGQHVKWLILHHDS